MKSAPSKQPGVKPWLLVLLAWTLTGCDAFRHVSECRRFVAATNNAVQNIQNEMAKAPDAQVAVYFNISGHYNALHLELNRMNFRNPQLEKAAKRFNRDVTTLSGETQAYAEAIQKKALAQDPSVGTQAEAQLETVRQRMQRVLESYNASLDKALAQCAPSK
jgi:septum formation inhibitor MinC